MGERRLLKLRGSVFYLLPFSASPALSRALLPARRPGIRRPRSSGAGAAVKWGRRKTLAFRKRFYLSSRRCRQSFFELGSCSSFFFLRSSASSSSSQHPPLSSKSKTPPFASSLFSCFANPSSNGGTSSRYARLLSCWSLEQQRHVGGGGGGREEAMLLASSP